MSPKDADQISNSVDPDQTAPLGTAWSGCTLFAQAYLSKNLGSLCKCSSTFELLTQKKKKKNLRKIS